MIIIYRVRCQICYVTHALIPTFLLPYKHYAVEEIEAVITQRNNDVAEVDISGTDASDETVKSWWRWYKGNSSSWLIDLRQKFSSTFPTSIINEANNNIWCELQELASVLWSGIKFTLPYLFFSHSSNLSSG